MIRGRDSRFWEDTTDACAQKREFRIHDWDHLEQMVCPGIHRRMADGLADSFTGEFQRPCPWGSCRNMEEKGMRILMLGNSFTSANHMPRMLSHLTGAEVVAHTRGGARLSEHLNPDTRMGTQTQAALRQAL